MVRGFAALNVNFGCGVAPVVCPAYCRIHGLGSATSPHDLSNKLSTLNTSSCSDAGRPPMLGNDCLSARFDVFTHGPRQLLRPTMRPRWLLRQGVSRMNRSNAAPCAVESPPANTISDGSVASRGT